MRGKIFGSILGALVIGFMILAGSSNTLAQEQQQPANPQQQEKRKPTEKKPTQPYMAGDTQGETKTISGTVKAGSGTTLTVVDSQKVEHAITVDANTKIVKAGKEDATLADLKSNDAVLVEVKKGTDGTLIALKITIQS